MEIKELVPSLELCKLIPQGEFADSAFTWWQITPFEEWNVTVRSTLTTIPAPTLQEIIAELEELELWKSNIEAEYAIDSEFLQYTDDNPATAALKLWLKLKGIEA